MFLKRSTDYDIDLVMECDRLLKKAEDEAKEEKEQKAVDLLNEACELLEDFEEHSDVCDGILSAIKKLNKEEVEEGETPFVEEITPSEDVEEEIQLDIDRLI